MNNKNEGFESDLKKENESLKLMIQNVDMGITRIDKDLNVLYANKVVEDWMGSSLANLAGKKCYTAFVKRDSPCPDCPGLKAIETGQPQSVITNGIRDNGKKFYVMDRTYPYFDKDGRVLGFNEILEDITENQAMQRQLVQEKQKMADILESTDAGTWDWDCLDGRIFIDERWASLIGYTCGEIEPVTRSFLSESIHPDDKEMVQEAIMVHHKNSVDNFNVDFRQKHKNGKYVWINSRGRVVQRDDQNRPLRMRGFNLDISQKKEVENNRLLLERQMQHTQKLESLGVLAGGIAHDFNNILMGVIGYAELSIMELPAESPVRDNLKSVITASMRANELAKQMLAYSGKGTYTVEPISINRMISEIDYLLKTCIFKSTILKYNFSENIPPIKADISQVRQVFMNLVTNASEAIEEKSGVVTISTGVMEVTEEYQRDIFIDNDTKPGYYTFIEVSDTGCGMDKDVQERVFDPFFTTKFTGRGLGMAATLGIIRGHKGAIKLYSEPGKGTTVKVLFPCCDAPVSNQSDQKTNQAVSQVEQKTVMVVDDEETVRILAKKTLENNGYNVLTAEDGRECLTLFGEHKNKIDLVILDITMPHVNGVEAYREMRIIKSDIKVILSSGYNKEEATKNFAGKGLAGFIQKPYLPSQLMKTIEDILD